MPQKLINVGSVASDATYDSLRTIAIKVNENFAEVYGVNAGGKVVAESIVVTTIVANATAVSVIASNNSRKTVGLLNSGASDAWYGWTNAVTQATGWPLYANGGGYTYSLNEAPNGAIYVFSVGGTTIVAKEGT